MFSTAALLSQLLSFGAVLRLFAIVVIHNLVGFAYYGWLARDAFLAAMFGSKEAGEKALKDPKRKEKMESSGKTGFIGSITGALLLGSIFVALSSPAGFNIKTMEEAIHLAVITGVISLGSSLIHYFWMGLGFDMLVINETVNIVFFSLDLLAVLFIGQLGF